MLEHADERVTLSKVRNVLREAYGLSGNAVRLTGERDANFHVLTDGGGEEFILKLSNSAEDPAVSNLQTSILLYLEAREPDLPTPRLRRSLNGDAEYLWTREDGSQSVARLLELLPGAPLRDRPLKGDDLEQLGEDMARLDRALRDFHHPADGHELLWDLQHADRLLRLLPAIGDAEHRALAERGLDRLLAATGGGGLRRQVIHNDLNPDNILVARCAPRVSGFIDFGDAVRAPLIQELAVAAAYQMGTEDDPLSGAAALARGYDQVTPLQEAEIERLPALIVGRLAMTVAITSWRAERHPRNRAYILRNQPAALEGLRRLTAESAARSADALRSAVRRVRP